MRYKLSLVFLVLFGCHIGAAQEIDYMPKPLQKDMQKIWQKEEIDIQEVEIPDSMYNDFLLEKGKIYRNSIASEDLGFTYIGRIYSCRAGGCSGEDFVEVQTSDEDFEYFDFYIIFSKELMVEQVRVYNYQATHGHEVGGKGWLKQFIGYKGDTKLELGKNIDSISGATISANAITYNVQESSRYFLLIQTILKNSNGSFKAMADK